MSDAAMKCRAVQRSASAFLDGRLSARERGAVQRHLRACPVCLHELQQLARLSRAMHNLPPHRIADGMAQRLRRQHDGSRAAPTERAATSWAQPRGLVVTRRLAIAAGLAATLPLVFWLGYRSGCAVPPAVPTAATGTGPTAGPPPLSDTPLIAGHAPTPPTPPPSALQPRVRPATPPPEVIEAPAASRPAPLAAPAPTREPADARLAGDRSAPITPPAPQRPVGWPTPDDVHRRMEQMLRDLLEQTRRR